MYISCLPKVGLDTTGSFPISENVWLLIFAIWYDEAFFVKVAEITDGDSSRTCMIRGAFIKKNSSNRAGGEIERSPRGSDWNVE